MRFVNVFCLRFSCFGWNFSAIAAAAQYIPLSAAAEAAAAAVAAA
jgi:hypothetical protein